MHISRSRVAVAAACGAALVFGSVSGAQAAAPRQAPARGVLAAEGQGGGLGAPSAADLRRATARPSAGAAMTIPRCQGTWNQTIAGVTVKESLKGGIPWKVALTKKLNSPMGTVNFRTQIFADGHEVAGNGTQKRKWDYNFHGTVPRTFVRADNKKKFTLPEGRVVSFFWTWQSVSKPNYEGYRYVICQFQP